MQMEQAMPEVVEAEPVGVGDGTGLPIVEE